MGGGGVRVGYTSYWSSKMDYHMHYGSSNNIIRDNYFINNGRQGVIVVWNSNHNTITRNHFENDGVSILYGRYNNVTYNHFNGTNPEPFIKIDREVEPSFDFSLYNRIEDNTITGVSTSLYPMLFPLIEISNHLDNNIVCSNNLSTTGKGGISVSSDRNLIINNTITGRGGLPDPDDIGIKLYYVKDCIVSNNTIELLHKGIYIDTSSGYVHSTNLTMKNNRMVNNLYHFYILTPQDVVAEGSPAFNDFDHDIDNSNIIMDGAAEKRIYYFKDVSDQIFDFSDAGFFACINCRNITVRYLTLKDNSHGILLFNTSDSLIGDVYVHKNHLAGISIYNSNNVTVNNTWIANNGGDDNEGKGVYLSLTDNTKLENCLIETNWCEGVNFDHSYGNTVSHSNITDNGPGSPDDYCSRGSGIRFIESDENTIHSNYILATAIPTYGGWTGGQTYGIYMFGAFSNNNTIYNNYFNSSGNAYDRRHDSAQDGGHNFWNITKTPGTNIIGGSYLGGNYWSDYAGADTTGEDGLGDTQVPYNSSGNIINGGDYHPLTVPGNDTTPPELSITSPVEGKNYGANYVYLKVYSPDSDVHSWWYSINNRSNVSFTPNTTITGLSNGQHSLVVYVNDTSGNVNYSIVNFTISVSTGGVSGGGSGFVVQEPLEEIEEEEVEFDIILTSPEDKRYTDREITLSYTSSVPLKRTSYILDGSTPVELQPLAPLTISRLTLGEHVLIVNGEDYYGMRGRAEVSFEVIPLTLGELESAGTPEFPEDMAFSFMGRSVDHKLTLEANIDGEVEVYVNKFLKEENGNKTLQDYTDNGELIGLLNDTGWATYEFNISADVLVPDAENIISFIHLNNSQGIDSEQWRIRNLNLIPRLDTQAPQIEVFTLDKSIAEGEELEFYVKIDGITNESAFDAYIYLLSPDGIIRYYSDWGDQQTLDPYYLRNNYYGRLPESLEFNGFVPGTYVMVGKIVEKGDTYPIALSTEKIYYDPQVSTRIYVDQVFTDGEELVIEHALTPGIEAGNGTVIISLEDPDHNRVYLPALSERIWGKSYSPLTSEFFTVFTGRVDSSWKNGTYVIRSDVYSDEGNLLAEDMRMFDICRETSKLSGRYIFDTFSSISLSQIQLIHANTLEIIENEITGGHSSYSINAPPGDYYLVGKAYGGDGRVFNIPLTPITLKCGEEVRRNIILRDTGVTFSEQEMEDMGLFMGSYNYDTLGESNSIISSLKSISFQENQDSCSKPKVYLMVGPPWNTSQVDQELVAKYERLTKQSSTNIKVYSYSDIRNVLAEQEQLLTENPGAEVDVSAVRQMVNADYLLRFSYTTLGSDYVMNSAILDVDRVEVVHGVSTSGSNRDSVLSNLIVSQGDIGATIRTWEMNKLPPRDPTISPALEPDTVTLEEGKNKATIKVRVVDCKGNPVEGARVYFDQITDRGYVKAEGGVEHYSGYVYSTTDENGNADATYVLNKGSKAGKDIMDIFVKARGNKKVHQKAVINIAGIGIEIVPEEEELSPGEDTLIHISLYSEDEKGERTPLKGKMILVEKYALLDSKISVLGECYEGTSNPVTDQDGKATLKFIAGKKEGLIKIPVSYQSLSYEDSVRDTTLIKVKKDEFIISIKWNEYNEYSRYYSTFIFQDETSGIYWYSFESKTIWDKRSGRESTTATLSLNSHVYGSTEENRVWSGCADWVASPFGHKCISDSETLLYKSTRKGVGNYNANVNSRITDVETVNTKLKQDVAGNLWIHIEPIRIPMPLSGNLEGKSYSQYIKESSPWESLQWTTIDSSSSEENLDIDYSGSNKNPNPAYQADCILSIPEAKRWTGCKYFSGLDFPGNYVKLTKTGENTYGAYHYFWGDRGDYSWRDDIFESSNLVEYEIRRGFDVTVVKR
ncbi:MAG: NosD domain-containing protein [Archaeoglobaceae archaeon]